MRDKYDAAIDYLMENPYAIRSSWAMNDPRGRELFKFIGPAGCGCLTQIKHYATPNTNEKLPAATEKLTNEIRADPRIPTIEALAQVGENICDILDGTSVAELNLQDEQRKLREWLEVFAEWQRRPDVEAVSSTGY